MGLGAVSSVSLSGYQLQEGWDFDNERGVLSVDLSALVGAAWGAEWEISWK